MVRIHGNNFYTKLSASWSCFETIHSDLSNSEALSHSCPELNKAIDEEEFTANPFEGSWWSHSIHTIDEDIEEYSSELETSTRGETSTHLLLSRNVSSEMNTSPIVRFEERLEPNGGRLSLLASLKDHID